MESNSKKISSGTGVSNGANTNVGNVLDGGERLGTARYQDTVEQLRFRMYVDGGMRVQSSAFTPSGALQRPYAGQSMVFNTNTGSPSTTAAQGQALPYSTQAKLLGSTAIGGNGGAASDGADPQVRGAYTTVLGGTSSNGS